MYQGNYLAERLSAARKDAGSSLFLRNHQTGEDVTYQAFFANAERMAQALVASGVKPGDRVAVQAPKTIAMLELYVATVLAGGVFLPLNTAYTPNEITYFLTDAEPRVFVCDLAREEEFSPVAKKAGVAKVLTIGADESGSLADLRDAAAPGFNAVTRGPDDLAAILYTSGTTGRSKGAMLTHQALASNAETLKDAWHFSADDVLIHALPIFHTHGLFVATNITLMAGSSCIFMPNFDADDILDYMPQATVLMGVPTFYVRLLNSEGLTDASANMRLFVSGSAPLLTETHEHWRDVTGHAILERYGMTETNMNTSNPYDGDRRAGTVGFPLPGIEMLVTNPATGAPLPQGETGVLEVRGPNVFAGYWKMPEKTAEELRDNGFFITGDLGRMDDDGYVHIVGRQKDLIISGGYNIYPKEIELLIDALEGINESAVIGVPHPDFGEAVVAVVVVQNGAKTSAADIMTGIKDDLARFKQPKRIEFVKSLPRNAMGKVQKKALREEYDGTFK
ncbi:malonyl-CoA/methylmalonyl-CoA synthetase [Yoonia rosea]|uniref:3-methylmercaptopropionyl-CoA ligase n=1 Tax=Yoonia rosea TaxID=287098 RepID=A0A1R3WV45_9RHOB|nr:malonyl-CoA synthase [Yoonia rosea]SIT82238.1 malonyl-CoA/methylmalonyl-CoA synthetase [Yoonia rosea]